MPTTPMNRVIQHLIAACGWDGDGLTDGELLTRFLNSRDDAALAALVRRHGSMVWGVCCRLLRSPHDADDAFQATFLVLVQKAATLPNRETVGNWLHGVAHQTAVRMRATTAKRGRRETQMDILPEPTAAEQYVWNDLVPVLDEELSRLPDKYRVLIVLCDLEGVTRKEVARRLDIPEGTAASRLAMARAMLAKRLTRRGVVMSSVLLEAMLSQQSAWASVPALMVSKTVKIASLLAAGHAATGVISVQVAALTEGVVRAMFVTKFKSVLAVLIVGFNCILVGGTIYRMQAAEPPVVQKSHAQESVARAAPVNSGAGQEKQPVTSEKSKTYQGLSAKLVVTGLECQADGPLEVTVTLASASESHRLFNPFFNGLMEQPGRILIYDSDGKVVNRLLEYHGGSQRTPAEGDYVALSGGSFVGKKIIVYPSRKSEGGESLPPGDYTMQLVLSGRLLNLGGKDAATEIVASERVVFKIVK